jgi:SAM-dependent methyltransferase
MDYEKEYQRGYNICGEPFPELLDFFNNYDKRSADVLDLGSGQGRDTLFIASMGHHVTGVDISPTGVSQMLRASNKRKLQIEGIVGNIFEYKTRRRFDVILFDRVLHLLPGDKERMVVLKRASSYLRKGGYILIADTPKDKKFITNFFVKLSPNWRVYKSKGNFQFFQRVI